MKLLTALTSFVFIMSVTTAHAVDPKAAQALAQSSGCLACHGVQNKVLGPGFNEVAAKYKGDKGAEARLIAKVKAGGSGVWGNFPMPANSPRVKDGDIKIIVNWILTTSK